MQFKEFLKSNPKYKYLIFDFDLTVGRIVIDWTEWHKLMTQILQKYNKEYVYESKAKIFEDLNENITKYGKDLRDELWAANEIYEAENITNFLKNPELIEFINNDNKYVKYIYTSNSNKTLMKAMDVIGLEDKFEKLVCRDDVSFIKPNPEGLKLIYYADNPKQEYLMVGDSKGDEDAAKIIGIDFFKIENVDWK